MHLHTPIPLVNLDTPTTFRTTFDAVLAGVSPELHCILQAALEVGPYGDLDALLILGNALAIQCCLNAGYTLDDCDTFAEFFTQPRYEEHFTRLLRINEGPNASPAFIIECFANAALSCINEHVIHH